MSHLANSWKSASDYDREDPPAAADPHGGGERPQSASAPPPDADAAPPAGPADETEPPSAEPEPGDKRSPWDIPENCFPVPGPGGVGILEAGNKIFRVMGEKKLLFTRCGGFSKQVFEVSEDGRGGCALRLLEPVRFCSVVEGVKGYRVRRREIKNEPGGMRSIVWRNTTMTKQGAEQLLASDPAQELLPSIRQIVSCPVLAAPRRVPGKRPRGLPQTLTKGYHSFGGGIYVASRDVPQTMPLEAAVNTLRGLFRDFSFASRADESRAVAQLLSPAMKMGGWIEDHFPLDVSEADQSQGGKTLRLEIVSTLYNAVPSTVTESKGRGVGGLEESLQTALVKGAPFIIYDNFRGRLDSPVLEQAIRGPRMLECRILRQSVTVDCSPFIWQLSTNGAELTRDLVNRSILTRIRKQPEGYRFHEWEEGDIIKHIEANRNHCLSAVFTILREWLKKGCPLTDENRHDFRGWCRAMDWIVQNIFSLPPLLDGHQENRDRNANPSLQWLRGICIEVKKTGRLNQDLAASDLAELADEADLKHPGNRISRDEPWAQVGKLMGRLFRDTGGEPLQVDGFTVSRSEKPVRRSVAPGAGSDLQKFYTVHCPGPSGDIPVR